MDDIMLPRDSTNKQLPDNILINMSKLDLILACEEEKSDINDVERYFDLKYYKLTLPEWFDSPLMAEEYIKTQRFIVLFNHTFWNYADRDLNGKSILYWCPDPNPVEYLDWLSVHDPLENDSE